MIIPAGNILITMPVFLYFRGFHIHKGIRDMVLWSLLSYNFLFALSRDYRKNRTWALWQDWAMRPLIGFVFTKRKKSQEIYKLLFLMITFFAERMEREAPYIFSLLHFLCYIFLLFSKRVWVSMFMFRFVMLSIFHCNFSISVISGIVQKAWGYKHSTFEEVSVQRFNVWV